METRWRETLVFELSGRRYGLPASEVLELIRIVSITPAPPGSGLVEGLINLRGAVIPVFDLRARLGLPPKPVEVSESLVIVRREGRALAFRVDCPLGLAALYTGDVVEGRGGSPEGHAVLLDLEALLEPVEAVPSSDPLPMFLAPSASGV